LVRFFRRLVRARGGGTQPRESTICCRGHPLYPDRPKSAKLIHPTRVFADASRRIVSAVIGFVRDATLYSVSSVAPLPDSALHTPQSMPLFDLGCMPPLRLAHFNHSDTCASISARPSSIAGTVRAVDCAFLYATAGIMLTHDVTATTNAFGTRHFLTFTISLSADSC
jgi:hypothetical protein